MLKLILEVLRAETELTIAFKMKGVKVVKPSLVLIGMLSLFYILSPIDIVPEKIITPVVFGFIDDLLVLAACVVYIMSNVTVDVEGGLKNVRDIKIPDLSNFTRKSKVPSVDERNEDVPNSGDTTNDGNTISNSDETVVGSTNDGTSDSSSNDSTSSQDDENDGDETNFTSDDEDFFNDVFGNLK